MHGLCTWHTHHTCDTTPEPRPLSACGYKQVLGELGSLAYQIVTAHAVQGHTHPSYSTRTPWGPWELDGVPALGTLSL